MYKVGDILIGPLHQLCISKYSEVLLIIKIYAISKITIYYSLSFLKHIKLTQKVTITRSNMEPYALVATYRKLTNDELILLALQGYDLEALNPKSSWLDEL